MTNTTQITKEELAQAREVSEALNTLDNYGVIHEETNITLWQDYLSLVLGMTEEEFSEVS